MKTDEKRLEYLKTYYKKSIRRFTLMLHRENDKDIIDAVERIGKGNKQKGFKLLVREGIKHEKEIIE